ncbi:MAG: mechanosensitive ion channel family protein [Polyangiaceae bacterium]
MQRSALAFAVLFFVAAGASARAEKPAPSASASAEQPSASALASALPAPSASAAPLDSAAPAVSAEPAPSAEAPPAAPVASVVALPASAAVAPLPSAAPAPSASSRPPVLKGTPVRLGETSVFSIRVSGAGKSPEERARLASKALGVAVEEPPADVRVQRQGDVALVYVGQTLIVQLFEDDAKAAGDVPLDVLGANIASETRQALNAERRLKGIQGNVYSISLSVLLALIAFYVARKLSDVTERVRVWLDESGDRVLAIRVKGIEIVTPAVLKSTAQVALGLAQWIGQLGIFVAWLVAVLSRFESTRGYTTQLTSFVVSPFSQLMGRLATALPLLVVASIAALVVFVLVRFLGLFFAGVARRETSLHWLPPDLAAPASVILRIAIVIFALIFAAPVVTGDSDGPLGRAGGIALIAIGLGAVPLLASGLVGSLVLFGRRLRVGEHVEVAGRLGRIAAINLLELRVELSDRSELHLPHLLLLVRPLRGLGVRPRLSVELATAVDAVPTQVIALLDQAAGRVGRDVTVELLGADAEGVLYRVSAVCDSLESSSPLLTSLLEGLSRAGVSLGRASTRARTA